MADRITLDVIDHPPGGALRTLRRAAALRGDPAPGLRAVLPLGTGHFSERPRPAPTPRRCAVLAVWEADADAAAGWRALIAPLTEGAGEHWHVRGELVRASFSGPWRGWTPEAGGVSALEDDEPALVLISGNLRPRYARAFFRDGAGAVAHANRSEGYLGGLAVASSPMNTTSCSGWRTYADARRYAFAAGPHADAMRRDRAEQHHRTEWFSRIRPLEERGTLNGATVFGDLLAPKPLAAA
jgi:hypothetical protein